MKLKIIFIFIIVVVLTLLGGSYWTAAHYFNKKEEEVKATEVKKTTEQAATSPAPAVEGLVPMYEGLTPCNTFVGWSCKVRTDGDPIKVSTKNYTWEIKGKGETPPPKEFQPGEAEIVSSDPNNPHVKVWVYKKISIRP